MSTPITRADLEAYIDEGLPAKEMSRIEEALRGDESLARQLAEIIGRRDAGVHTLGAIWRRERTSCPARTALGSYLLQAVSDDQAEYIRFHLEVVACRFCQANLEDLRQQAHEATAVVELRRRRYFQSSAGLLRKEE